jgi:ketosteroid isomerase-like protein
VVDQFHHALAQGDSATAAGLLHGDVIVLESGALETRADYLRHHLPADIAFARAVRTDRRLHRLTQRGDVAWVASTSRTTGEFDGRAVDSDGAELMVLHRTPTGWRIASIHWSSRRHRS